MRSQFDINFKQRSMLWNGAYPRPSIESIKKTWKYTDSLEGAMLIEDLGVEVDLDPDLDYSTYPIAL